MFSSRTIAVAATVLWLSGCQNLSVERALIALGLADAPQPPAERIAILCDHSSGSTCTPEVLAAVIDTVLAHVSARPGSRIAIYTLGPAVETTRLVASAQLAAPPTRAVRDARAFNRRQIDRTRAAVLDSAATHLKQGPRSSSPLAESVAKVFALEDPHHLVVVSDGFEESDLGRWECGPLPDANDFLRQLRRANLLGGGNARPTVSFAFRTLDPVDGARCPLGMDRVRHIEHLWRLALFGLRARGVYFYAAAPDLGAEHAAVEAAEAQS